MVLESMLLSNTVSVISTARNKVIHKIRIEGVPAGVAMVPESNPPDRDEASRKKSPQNPKLYLTTLGANTVKVTDTARNRVIDTIAVGYSPLELAPTSDGTKVYVANENSDNIGDRHGNGQKRSTRSRLEAARGAWQ